LITDCASFLAEYLPTQKPIIHIRRNDSIGYNCIGNAIVKDYYKAYNLNELVAHIERVLINNDDYLYNERMKALNLVVPNREKASTFIINYIKQEVGL
jgi:hypothetical protein